MPFHNRKPDSGMQRSNFKGHPGFHSGIPTSNWEQKNGFFHYVEPNEYKDVYEIWQRSQKFTHKGRYDETAHDKKMALVRQKFFEAKRLSMDEKLRQSKQFQDALEVLNSNKDLFLKCLQEPTSTTDGNNFAGAGNKEGKQMKKGSFVQPDGSEKSHLGSSPPASRKNYENPTQPTRIVVLKPSLGKIHDDKAVGSPQYQSARMHGQDFFGDVEDNENQESREVAKAITQQMRETWSAHRDETLISSLFSTAMLLMKVHSINQKLSIWLVISAIQKECRLYLGTLGIMLIGMVVRTHPPRLVEHLILRNRQFAERQRNVSLKDGQ
ncbi:UNVERIFIED_CONTAM: hypothetical protein Sradi_1272600 [Sesamum radiatum]|uniref:DUF3741 domain-containing protein n=1 Tax=Sesamum radiatum TaxID=300843 RepID=A0AAW2URD1_SESRA